MAGHLEFFRGGSLCGWAVVTSDGTPVPLLPIRVTMADGTILVEGVASEYRVDVADAGLATGWSGFEVPVPTERLVAAELVLQARVGETWHEVSRVFGADLLASSLDLLDPEHAEIESLLVAFGRAARVAAVVPKESLRLGDSVWVQASSADAGHVQVRLRLEPRERTLPAEPLLSVESDRGAIERVDLRFRLALDTGRVAAVLLIVPMRPLGADVADFRLSRFDHEGRRVIGDFRLPCNRWTDVLAEVPAHHCLTPIADPTSPLGSVWFEVLVRSLARLDVGQIRVADVGSSGFESARVAAQAHLLDPWAGDVESPPERPRYSVVVPFHGNRALTAHCVAALASTCSGIPEVIAVDDGSSPGPGASLLRGLEGVRVLDLGANRGYTAAVNAGVQAASHERVVILNNDTRPTPGWDLPLMAALDKPDVVAAGPLSNAASYQSMPRTRDDDGTWAVNSLPPGVRPDQLAMALRRAFGGELLDWPVLNGFCYAIRREDFLRLGALDQAAFPSGYGEEVDFMLRARQAGLRAVVCPDSFVYHYKSKSMSSERGSLTGAANSVLRSRWGEDLDEVVASMESHTPLDDVRMRFSSVLGELVVGGWPS